MLLVLVHYVLILVAVNCGILKGLACGAVAD